MNMPTKRAIELLSNKENKVEESSYYNTYEIITPKNKTYDWNVVLQHSYSCSGYLLRFESSSKEWGLGQYYTLTYNKNRKHFGTLIALLKLKCPKITKKWLTSIRSHNE